LATSAFATGTKLSFLPLMNSLELELNLLEKENIDPATGKFSPVELTKKKKPRRDAKSVLKDITATNNNDEQAAITTQSPTAHTTAIPTRGREGRTNKSKSKMGPIVGTEKNSNPCKKRKKKYLFGKYCRSQDNALERNDKAVVLVLLCLLFYLL